MIIKLPDDIIAKIAAGEVVTSPYNIIKETLENSIDANAQNISITISGDNLNLEIHDDGDGIQKEDFKLLCQRHCTSKFDGLSNIQSFGFRGEALGSISVVAKVRVVSRTKDCEYGYEAVYNCNEMTSLKMKAANNGTTVFVDEIFHNHSIRRNFFWKRKSEIERNYYLLANYSIYYTYLNIKLFVGENLKESYNNHTNGNKFGLFDRNRDLEAKKRLIKQMYKLENDLLEIADDNLTALISHINCGTSKFVFILFINGRMVESNVLKDKVKQIYNIFLPNGKYPFVYLELYIDKNDVDVNVHPCKKEVLFFREEQIHDYCVKKIKSELETKSNMIKLRSTIVENKGLQSTDQKDDFFVSRYKENRMLYTDPNSSTLFDHSQNHEIQQSNVKKVYKLKSIKELKNRLEIIDDDFFKHLVYVGEFNEKTLVQNAHMLMMCDLCDILDFYFYQRLLYNIGCFDILQKNIKLTKPLHEAQCAFLNKYFNIKIHASTISQIPVVDKIYIDDVIDGFLSVFTDYEMVDEKECFDFVIKGLANLYKQKYNKNEQSFNMLKKNIRINKGIKAQFSVVTTLQELYKLFDRC